ncbi:hypothetical protein HPP92_024033 [Vanilla planifolia]|uniref:Lactate/malate dehydrogenase C-terminal domain-containing protein n=1 Tax=Vanilla planifolia TaxID=51239 RepID=A0A835PM55_VANPL|nr:hypothetical protein HPP92_024033 [Vanilla planifolia]
MERSESGLIEEKAKWCRKCWGVGEKKEECTPDIVECNFVQSNVTELPFFASKVRLGKNGIEEVLGLGPLSEFEKQGLESLKPELKLSIEKGIKFAREN